MRYYALLLPLLILGCNPVSNTPADSGTEVPKPADSVATVLADSVTPPLIAADTAKAVETPPTKPIGNNSGQSNANAGDFKPVFAPGPQVLVYKTKADYNDRVPVILSEDKSKIVSYPHPSDVKIGKGYPLPGRLHGGYLLDNRGIGPRVAFLKTTYAEYAQLESAPTLAELYALITDKDPLLELCNCGAKTGFNSTTTQLNQLIDSKKLRTTCKAIK
jgi:hypothetical protein